MISVKKNKGFTLVELMVTLGVFGVLMSLAIPGYKNYLDRAKAMEGISLLLKTSKEVEECMLEVITPIKLTDCLGDNWQDGLMSYGGGYALNDTNAAASIGNTSNLNFNVTIIKGDNTSFYTYHIIVSSKVNSANENPKFRYTYFPLGSGDYQVMFNSVVPTSWIQTYGCLVINERGDCYDI